MRAAPGDEGPVERRRWRSAVLLAIGVGAFGMFDPPSGAEAPPPGGTIVVQRYFPPVATEGGTQLGPATRISRVP